MLCFLELTISYSALTCLWLGNSNEFFISQNVFLNSRIFITFFYKSFIYLYNIYIFINWPLNMFLLISTKSFILLIPTLRSSVVSCWQLYSLEYVPRFLASSHAWYFFSYFMWDVMNYTLQIFVIFFFFKCVELWIRQMVKLLADHCDLVKTFLRLSKGTPTTIVLLIL